VLGGPLLVAAGGGWAPWQRHGPWPKVAGGPADRGGWGRRPGEAWPAVLHL